MHWPRRSCSPGVRCEPSNRRQGACVYICPPQDDKRKTGLARQGVGCSRGWVFDTATLEPVDWLWLWQTPVAIKDASESGVVRLAL